MGALDPAGRVGWLGRYLDQHGAPDNPLQGLSLDYTLAPSLATSGVPVAAVAEPENYSLWARDVWDRRCSTRSSRAGAARARSRPPTPSRDRARRRRDEHDAAHAARRDAGPHRRLADGGRVPAGNNAFPRRLASLAEMIARGLPLRVVALDANGGYDTHENQQATLDTNFGLMASSLAAFQADLEARGIADRVLVHVWSEFGRRPQANGSGTDHGAGGASLVMGTQAKGTMVGEFPGLATLDRESNLRQRSTSARSTRA